MRALDQTKNFVQLSKGWLTAEGCVGSGLLSAPDGWNVEQIRQFQEWFDSVLAGNTAGRTRLAWAPGGSRYQAFSEAPYKDEFDEWLARIVCYAFSLPPTAFTKQVNRATAETSQAAALDEGMAPSARSSPARLRIAERAASDAGLRRIASALLHHRQLCNSR